ncbi:MAG: glycosyltransferase family 2 protein [Planctomycetota bacterium]|jgi:GT2 family glycosyltransferase
MSKPDPEEVERALIVPPTAPLTDAELPRVSIVILNWNGRHHLEPCFSTLRRLDYPEDRFEVVLVDNGSDDGSQQEARSKHPWVRLVENDRNVGFSAGCNQGATVAAEGDLDPEVLVFLNNDIHVDEGFLRELVAPVVRGEAVATTAKMMSWDGKVLNSAAGGMNFHGIGIQRGYLRDPDPKYDQPRKTLFACGGAMAMDREAYFDVGGFDEEFFAYYEDVDLGWRTWVHGHEVRYVPSALCYHHHSSTSGRVPVERLRLLQIRNPQLACVKNYDDENLRRVLPAILGLAVRRAFMNSALPDVERYRIEAMDTLGSEGAGPRFLRKLRKNVRTHDDVGRVAIADLVGMNDLLGRWDHWMERRKAVQDRRARPDSEILPLFLRPMWCIEGEPAYRELHEGLGDFLGLNELFDGLTTMDDEPGP